MHDGKQTISPPALHSLCLFKLSPVTPAMSQGRRAEAERVSNVQTTDTGEKEPTLLSTETEQNFRFWIAFVVLSHCHVVSFTPTGCQRGSGAREGMTT